MTDQNIPKSFLTHEEIFAQFPELQEAAKNAGIKIKQISIEEDADEEGAIVQGSDAWHLLRLAKITGSRFNEASKIKPDKEIKSKDQTKTGKIAWLIEQGKIKELEALAEKYRKEIKSSDKTKAGKIAWLLENGKDNIEVLPFENAKEVLEKLSASEVNKIYNQTKGTFEPVNLKKLSVAEIDIIYNETPGTILKGGLTLVAEAYLEELIGEALTGTWKEIYSKACSWGTEKEPEAIEHFEQKTGFKLSKSGFIVSDFHEKIGVSLDGENEENDFTAEFKCPYNTANHVKTLRSKKVPKQYMDQVQGGLMVTGRSFCWFVSYDPRVISEDHKMIMIKVERDEAYIADLKQKLLSFADILESELENI